MRNLVLLQLIGTLSCFVACTDDRRNPEFCGDGFCIDDALPFCDIDGSIAGQAKTCIAVSCTPGAFEACRGNETIACNATGDNFDVLECASGCIQGAATCTPCSPGETRCRDNFLESCSDNGAFVVAETCDVSCNEAATPHCAYLEPKYLPDGCDAPATGITTFNTSSFDTDSDINCTGGVVDQVGGPSICIVRAQEISIPDGATLSAKGTRALALVADNLANIAGTLNVSAVGIVPGPGGGIGTTASKGGRQGGFSEGGGGGGFATTGGSGGSTSAVGGAANGGPASTNPAMLTILVGGASGGGGFPNGGALEEGGGGAGGAVMVVACRGNVKVSGAIIAGGGGAAAATRTRVGAVVSGSPGYGGGSGGNVVIQGMDVEIVGRMFANGGGGGSGNEAAMTMGSTGGDGGALGGLGGIRVTGTNNGSGGDGAAPSPASGGKPPSAGMPATPGGGGGSVGFLQTYTPSVVTPMLNPTAQSPDLQPNRVVNTR